MKRKFGRYLLFLTFQPIAQKAINPFKSVSNPFARGSELYEENPCPKTTTRALAN
jgi:hypothetical protein